MIAAVFGGNGFIGSHLVERLLLEGYRVRIFDRSPPDLDRFGHAKRLEFFVGNFPTELNFSEILEGCDIVFQLISTTLPNSSNENLLADVEGNLIPTLRLLDQMRAAGVPRLVFPSSGGTVYGQAQRIPIDEKHPTQPIVSYGATKLAIEKYLSIFEHTCGLRSICLRISNPYGPGFRFDSPQGAIGAFLNKAISAQPITLWGDGKIRRDYLYINDLIDAMIASIFYSGDDRIFNISTGIGTSLLELIELIQSATGRTIEVNHFPSRSFDVQTNILDNSLALRELDWHPKISLPQGIDLTADWLRGDRGNA